MFKKQSEVQSDLQAIADQVGAARFEAAKAEYLKGLVVTSDEGSPLKPEDIKFEVTVKAADEPAAPAQDIAALVAAEVAKHAKPAPIQKAAAASNAITATTIEPYRGRSKVFKSAETAYRFGMFAAGVAGWRPGLRFCAEKGIGIEVEKVGIEGSTSLGGALVPDEFANTIIDLKEQYGVFAQYAQNVQMGSDTFRTPRRTGGLTAYFVGENAAITASDMGWDLVTLSAKKMGVLTKTSSELNEDSVITLADTLAREIAYAFAAKEDACGFNGDGTSTYGGITGLKNAIGAGGVATAATNHDTMAEIDAADTAACMGKLPKYAWTPNTAWYCSQSAWANWMQRLAITAGGAMLSEVVNGVPQLKFYGYPVRITQSLPTSDSASQIIAYFGDLSLSSQFGSRRGVTIGMATQGDTDFANDLISWRGTERFDIVNHSVGNASVAGAIVALKTAS